MTCVRGCVNAIEQTQARRCKQQDTATHVIRACEDEPRHARVGGRERDVEGVVHGLAALFPGGVRVRVHGAKVDHGVGAPQDGAPRSVRRVAGALGVPLYDGVAGRRRALRAVVGVLDAHDLDASFLEVGAELSS